MRCTCITARLPAPTFRDFDMGDIEKTLQAQVADAYQNARTHLRRLTIVGGGSKSFYGRTVANGHGNVGNDGETLKLSDHCGILTYDPAELVITARAGTRIADIEKSLVGENQMLGFEPPQFSPNKINGTGGATIGGAVASGLSGPRRPYCGAVRDFVLGVKIINGRGEVLKFGGEVMKNVAGFDIARLMCGAMGTLGVLLEVSLRVVPKPPCEMTLKLAHAKPADALAFFNQLSRHSSPLSAAAWHADKAGKLAGAGESRIRLSGGASVDTAAQKIINLGGEVCDGNRYWRDLRDHKLPFFQTAAAQKSLLRVALPAADNHAVAAKIDNAQSNGQVIAQFIDWGGAQRWICGDGEAVREIFAAAGNIIHFRHTDPACAIFPPLSPPLHNLQLRIKHAFDPHRIFNRGRIHPDI